MAQTLSLAIVIGNLGADPEIRTGQDGHRVAFFRLATDSHRTDTHTPAAASPRLCGTGSSATTTF
ncbi:single-stranded DNA-binding protein [Gluconobacter cerinus]|uniref:single-stranded DNA-binding protein n=1 Tax=Gluconobacter TaxID=441 RepID=UPI001B8C8D38|nr:single-stranded DNA-binding protein [Gluconobacter cerinus]MBS1072762.1 single-stranded DNA-binding protein [Gluconobacter cerinus]